MTAASRSQGCLIGLYSDKNQTNSISNFSKYHNFQEILNGQRNLTALTLSKSPSPMSSFIHIAESSSCIT